MDQFPRVSLGQIQQGKGDCDSTFFVCDGDLKCPAELSYCQTEEEYDAKTRNRV